jgi:hypothetical protein
MNVPYFGIGRSPSNTKGTLAIAVSLLDGVAQASELVGLADDDAIAAFLLVGLVRAHCHHSLTLT